MRYVVTGIALAALAGCAGDSTSSDVDRTKVGYSVDELRQSGAPQGAIDPVSGEWVPEGTLAKTSYEGMTYYFAAEQNREAFERRPHEFVTADGYLRRPLDEVRREAEVK